MKKIKIGALISGGGSNLQAIIDAALASEIAAEIVFVGSDNPEAKGLKRAVKASIPTFVTDYSRIIRAYREKKDSVILPDDVDFQEILRKQNLFPEDADPEMIESFFKTRIAAESDLLNKITPYNFDLLVLAGFMRTLTPYFIDMINKGGFPRIMNIHPALLPSFPGVDGYKDTFEYGCKVGGCTVHFIDYGEDSGPIIGQKSFPIESDDTLDDVKKKGLELEWQLFPECIELYAQGQIRLERMNDKPVVRLC